MKTLVPMISAIFWGLWTIRGAIDWLSFHPFAPAPEEQWNASSAQFMLGLQACGTVCSVLLWKTGLRVYALMLVPLSLFGGWKGFFGAAILKMLPGLGGLTFAEAMAGWWDSSTADAWIFLRDVPTALFLLLSAFFWPFYALFAGKEKNAALGAVVDS